jgi:hypothetical protein
MPHGILRTAFIFFSLSFIIYLFFDGTQGLMLARQALLLEPLHQPSMTDFCLLWHHSFCLYHMTKGS